MQGRAKPKPVDKAAQEKQTVDDAFQRLQELLSQQDRSYANKVALIDGFARKMRTQYMKGFSAEAGQYFTQKMQQFRQDFRAENLQKHANAAQAALARAETTAEKAGTLQSDLHIARSSSAARSAAKPDAVEAPSFLVGIANAITSAVKSAWSAISNLFTGKAAEPAKASVASQEPKWPTLITPVIPAMGQAPNIAGPIHEREISAGHPSEYATSGVFSGVALTGAPAEYANPPTVPVVGPAPEMHTVYPEAADLGTAEYMGEVHAVLGERYQTVSADYDVTYNQGPDVALTDLTPQQLDHLASALQEAEEHVDAHGVHGSLVADMSDTLHDMHADATAKGVSLAAGVFSRGNDFDRGLTNDRTLDGG